MNELFTIQPKEVNVKVGTPAYFDAWLIEDCKVSVEHNCECINVVENFNAGNRINFALMASKGGAYELKVIGIRNQKEPEPEIPPEQPTLIPYIENIATLETLQNLHGTIQAGNIASFSFEIAKDLNISSVSLVGLDSTELAAFSVTNNADTDLFVLENFQDLFIKDDSLLECKVVFTDNAGQLLKEILLNKEIPNETAGIVLHELVVNGTEKLGDNNADGNTEANPPDANDSTTSIPAIPIVPAIRVRQEEILRVYVEIEIPKELQELTKLFPELAPTMQSQEDIEKWEAVLKKVKCIYQEFSQPKTECEAYPLLVLVAHYGVINGLGNAVGITRADGVVASSSVGDVSVSFQTQPYGNNEFTYFLGLTKYGLEFLAWLNRRSGLFYAN
ncbi:DUF4054 domain-containing protein [Helicobacter ganmani]|uniref:DUF4054 domain-containing protein n=1 Tax=Helicobacter ganmani TaxID=60246 RepID=UPI003A869FF2